MTQWKTLIVPCLFLGLLIAEHGFPLRKRKEPLLPRLVINRMTTACVFLVGTPVAKTAGLSLAGWTERRGLGLGYLLPLPPWAGVLLGVLSHGSHLLPLAPGQP